MRKIRQPTDCASVDSPLVCLAKHYCKKSIAIGRQPFSQTVMPPQNQPGTLLASARSFYSKGVIMKPIRITILFSLVMLLTSLTLNAQSISTVKANIPFSFVVGSKSCAAGEYSLRSQNLATGVVLVQRVEDSKAAASLTQPLYFLKGAAETQLVFNRYKDDTGQYIYFLSKIWVAKDKSGVEFVQSRAEREAAKGAIKRDMITLVVPNPKGTAAKGD